MINNELGNTGLNVSRIGFGGIPIQRLAQSEVNKIMKHLTEQGINFIDTARAYTVSESYIGEALKDGLREKFILATKTQARTYDAMKADIETSLKNLQTDYIDLYQLHLLKTREDYDLVMSENGAYRALKEAKAAGKIGHIGVTAHNAVFLESLLDEMPFETIQFPYNLVERQAEMLFERAKAKGIGVIVMKPLAGGALDNADLSIRFILENKNVDIAIPGMDSIEQVTQNAAIGAGNLPLSESECLQADQIALELGTQFCRRCGYCLPCAAGIDIPMQFLLEGYLTRYDLNDYATTRYVNQPVDASACIKCGLCEPRCPYHLPIREMLTRVTKAFAAVL
ncbi:aldo/keto reductase [Fusibacter paucivorans]|uniref:Aldo/keto reductase n=1 Tax=Fusibacter paucivorans TaxID=76009 RepID=A0ABS5PPT4_9FIRM|nr:aldo/keto reductase [Fusibacter paucivorans]MBS7527051.1 aldo/keto reductase [Fusibacter paucivorans]